MRTRQTLVTRTMTAAAAIALTWLAAGPSQAGVVYQDNFDGASGSELDGHAPDIDNSGTSGGAAWQALPAFKADGVVEYGLGGAYLPFEPQADRVYTATTTLTNEASDWVAFGFSRYDSFETDNDPDRHTQKGDSADGYSWLLTRNKPDGDNQQGFKGPDATLPPAFSGNLADPTQPVELTVKLDTRGEDWTGEILVDGTSQATVTYSDPDEPDIHSLGYSREGVGGGQSSANATISDLSLTVVPEPASLALLGVGGLTLAGRPRRRRRDG